MPNLKVLHIEYLQMQFEYSNGELGGGYPLLEDVRMDHIGFPKNGAILKIALPSLKKFAFADKGKEECRIDIDVSLVQYFEYSSARTGRPSIEISACKFESLVAANLSTTLTRILLGLADERFVNIIRMVHKVKSLHLSDKFVWVLHDFAGSLPRFPNLTCLELTARNDRGRKTMWSLFQRAPNLETLVCDMDGYRGGSGAPENEPLCLAQKVREIRIRNYTGAEAEFEAVRYLLQHGAVLERMILVRPYYETKEWPSSMLMQLLKLRRRSAKCEIELEHA